MTSSTNSTAAPLLALDNLRISTAAGTPLVSGVSIALRRGETLGIVGQSGSGKSMLCKAALGILPEGVSVTGGSARFDGADLLSLDYAAWRELRGPRIGAVFQDPASFLNPSVTVGRQLAEVFRVTVGLPQRAARDAAVELFAAARLREPDRVYDRYPYELSGGMLQRVAIAMAIAPKPQLLIADEATTALDVTVQASVLRLLTDAQRDLGLAMLFVSHDLAVIAQVSDHIVVLLDGEVVEAGPADEVLQRPKHAFTRSLIESHERFGIERHLDAESIGE